MPTRIVWTILLVSVLACSALADVPGMISYQGKLMQPSGAIVPDGTYSIRFAIYEAPTGGTPLWSETNPGVQVKGGLFATMLGSVVNLPSNIFDSPNRFFGVKVGDDPEMTPRQQIASVAYAVKAGSADIAATVPDGAITAEKIAEGSITTAKLAPGVTTPPGTVSMFGGSSAPVGWLLCNGAAISRTTYASLFAAIGTTFGSGDGATTFNLPDMRGIFPKGSGSTDRPYGKDASGNYYSGVVGEYRQDQLQGHKVTPSNANARFVTQRPAYVSSAGLHYVGYEAGYSTGGDTGIDYPTGALSSDGMNGIPRTGHTTEPQSLGINFLIKY